jgi:hypothetical protein
MTDLSNVKVGDELTYWSGGVGTVPALVKVVRTTKTRVIVNAYPGQFWKKNGWAVGTRRGSLHPVTDEDQQAIKRNGLLLGLRDLDLRRLSTDALEKIQAIVSAEPGSPA